DLLSPLPQILLSGGGLTINGTGAANLTIRRSPSATSNFRVFESLSRTLNISGLTLSGGNPAVVNFNGRGGAIFSSGIGAYVNLNDVNITANHAIGQGGGIFISGGGFLQLRNSAVLGNTSDDEGGGIYFFSGGSLLMENSTVSGNTSSNSAGAGGGGIYFGAIP